MFRISVTDMVQIKIIIIVCWPFKITFEKIYTFDKLKLNVQNVVKPMVEIIMLDGKPSQMDPTF